MGTGRATLLAYGIQTSPTPHTRASAAAAAAAVFAADSFRPL